MGRLFWKLFSAFWLAFAVILVGALFGMKIYRDYLEHEFFENSTRPETHTVARTLAEEGEEATIRLLKELHHSRKKLNIVVVDEEGRNLMSYPLHRWVRRAIHESRKHPLSIPQRKVTTPSGKSYRVISLGRHFGREGRPLNPKGHWQDIQWMVLSIAGVVSLLLCFWLARYLSRPVKQLSSASRSYSEGDLDVRVSPAIGRRKDEIADLARDFDTMAEKLQVLIGGQQQLLRDVSHELRSPLARLQMAVGLARKREEGLTNNELDRIERDVKRLGELVGQVLTLSRLETNVADTRTDFVDVTALLETIVDDADFEAHGHNRRATMEASVQPHIMADAELLRQALENIVRNAIKYTAENTSVDVSIDTISFDTVNQPETGFLIQVCDRGPGVPDDMLDRLFDPFVRISEARERESHAQHAGGYGLGLAIAKRAIERHGGKVTASNRDEGGLCIDIFLPADQPK